MKILKRISVVALFIFQLTSCGVQDGSDTPDTNTPDTNIVETTGPDLGSAVTQIPLKDRRIAIVHSQSTKAAFYSAFAYNQLFASIQHQSMMAGVPFDLLDESELASTADLLNYDVIVMPLLTHVPANLRQPIKTRLLQAQENGVGIITSAEFMGSSADGTAFEDFSSAMSDVLGVVPSTYLSAVAATVKVANVTHPVNKTYTSDEALADYDEIWFAHFVASNGEQSTPLTVIESGGQTYNGAQIIERTGRVIHFSNEQVMADNNQLWRVIQWLVYGDTAPAALQISRSDHVFLARNDMDQAMIAAQLPQTEIPLLDIIKDWKRDYNFVGSYYIDIGNNPTNGEYTDWSVSGPLYKEYIDLGNEIATHSWTHPHYTSLLTAPELEFEFKDSAAEIGSNVGVPVTGAAVPGTAESLFVVETLNPWLDYLSGRTGTVGSGYQGAIGFLEPQHDMMYFSLNLSPDFTLIDYLNKSPADATAIWQSEIDTVLNHAQQPIVHWLWHDYGPTTQTAIGRYTKEMFTDTIEYATSKGAEFATVDDIHKRIRTYADIDFSVGAGSVIKANVNATGVGQFAIKVAENKTIRRVDNWYAYDEDQIFLPDTGGEFTISLGRSADPVTRISELPMRARLMSLTGDGNQLNFSFQGEGDVSITLSQAMVSNASVTGPDSFSENNGVLTLSFNTNGTHQVAITPVNPINVAPVASGGSTEVETSSPMTIVLNGSDADGDALSFEVKTQPINGVLTGTPPELVYVSNTGFTGSDVFSYVVSDGVLESAPSTVDIVVISAPVPNSAPQANGRSLETIVDNPLDIQLSGSDNENQPLTYRLITPPANGQLTGTIPNLTYVPNAGYIGRDSFEFVANDSVQDSAIGQVFINVEPSRGTVIGTVSNPIGAVNLNGDLTEWASLTSFGSDPQDISGTNNDLDWSEAWMSHDDTNFYIAYREHGAAQITWGNQIYIDADTNGSTGFLGFSNEFTIGADYLIEGNALFRFSAPEGNIFQNQWAWDFLGYLESVSAGNSVELILPRSELQNPDNIILFFYGNSAATGGDSIDYYPDGANDPAAVLRDRHFSYSVNPNPVPDNFAPVAFAQRIQISNNASYPLTLVGFDPDGDDLEFQLDLSRLSGTLSGTAPNFIYTPNGNTDLDFLSYSVTDGIASSDSRSIQFFMAPPPAVNNRPAVNNQTLQITTATSKPITLTGSDADADTLTFTVVNPPVAGSLTGTPPNLTYTAQTTTGVDSFTYIASDGIVDSTVGTVVINIESEPPANSIPQAESQALTTAFQTAISITLGATDADGDSLDYALTSQPGLGTLAGTAPDLTYIPFTGATGTDTFSFTVSDGITTSAVASVAVEVLAEIPINQAPTAHGQSLTGVIGQPINITLSGVDPDQDPLTYTVLTQPQSGTLSGTAPDLIYTPAGNFSGVDSFTFTANDGQLDSSIATISISVNAPTAGVISNPVASITIDGSLADWNGLTSLGSDPADIAGVVASNPIDWREAWVAHSTTELYIAYRNHEAFSLSWGHGVYIDIDGDINTGFRGFNNEFPIGADYLIETDDVQQYTGAGNNWGWLTTAPAEVMTNGEIGEVAIPLSAIANPQTIRFYFRGNNSAFGGNTVDHFPDSAVTTTAPSPRYLEYQIAP